MRFFRRERSLAAILAGAVAVAALVAALRPLDGDEGYYAAAARLVAMGRLPYLDFFYPQTPVLPFILAPFTWLCGASLWLLRTVPVLTVALAAWCLALYHRGGRERPGIPVFVAVLMLVLDPHFLSWNVTLKTYGAANLGVLAALAALDRGVRGRELRWFAVGGAAAALTVGVRLLYAGWAAVLVGGVAVLLWREREAGRKVGALAAGVLAGAAPTVFFLARDPDRFLFNTLRYHQLRFSVHDLSGAGFGERAADALAVLGGALAAAPYLVLLLALAVWGLRSLRDDRTPEARLLRIWSLAALVHFVVCLLPDPAYRQYFTAAWSPLVIPPALAGLADLWRRARQPRAAAALASVLLACYAVLQLAVLHTGMDMSPVWTRPVQNEVAAAIDRHSGPRDTVLAFWSGFPYTARRNWAPGMENHFALGVAGKLDARGRNRYHIAGVDRLGEMFRARTAKVVVLGGWMHEINTQIPQQDLAQLLAELDRNYLLVEAIGEVKIMIPRETGD